MLTYRTFTVEHGRAGATIWYSGMKLSDVGIAGSVHKIRVNRLPQTVEPMRRPEFLTKMNL
jgi:hypothetical protein